MPATLNSPRNSDRTPSPKSGAIDHITRDLDKMVSRLRREIWIGGSLAIVAAALACILALIVTDAIFHPESTGLRLALWIPLIGVVAAVAVRYLVVPLRSECGRMVMAWTLEQQRPAIEERLTSSLQLSETANGRTSALIDAVAQQAQERLAECQQNEIRGQEVLRRTLVAGTCLATFALSIGIWAPYLVPSLQNVLAPWNARVLPYLNARIDPCNTIVGEGSDLRIAATANDLTDAVLEILEEDSVIATHRMAPDETGITVDFTLTELKADLLYRVRSGGLFSDRYQIVVEPKPVVERVEVGLTFPEYTKLPPQVVNNLSEPIEAIHRTSFRVDVDATLSCPDSSLTLNGQSIPCGKTVPIEETELWRHSWVFTATDDAVQGGTITLLSEAGVLSEPLAFEFQSLPDLPPSIVIDQPALPEVTATADRTIDVEFHAFDDFGCTALQLVTQKNGDPPSVKEIPHNWETEGNGELTVDLSELEVSSGDHLTVWLSISDNRPEGVGGSQVAESRKLHIQIADNATSVGEQSVKHQNQKVQDNLTAAIANLKAAEEIADKLNDEIADVGDTADRPNAPLDVTEKAKQLQNRINDAEQALRQLSGPDEVASQGLFQQEIERIREVTDNEVAEAKKEAGLVPLSDDRPQQQEAIAATKESLNDAVDKLEEAREEIERRSKQLELAAQLDELARQQEQLAQDLDAGQANAPDAQAKQQQVTDALQDVVERDLDARSEQFSQRAEKAAALSEKAAELQERQEALAKLDQIRSEQELDDQLREMIAIEQEQIAERTERLQREADELLQLPTDDAENQQAVREAREKLQQAQKDTRAAEQLTTPQRKQATEQQKQSGSPKQAAKQQEQAGDPEQAGEQQQQQAGDPKQAGKQQQQASDPKQAAEQQQQVGDPKQAGDQQRQQAAESKPAGEQQQQTGDPKQSGEQQQQTGDPNQTGEQRQAGEQQKQAAKSLQEATESLDAVCKSCKKCSQCNKPSTSSGSGGGASKQNSLQSETKPEGDQSSRPQPGQNSGWPGQTSPAGGKPDAQKLAAAADKAHETARTPSPDRTRELAQDLNELADEAAEQAGYPNRDSKSQGRQSQQQSSSQQAGIGRPGRPTNPQGVRGNADTDQSEVAPTQLRGRSSSTWTRSRRKLKSNVLDDEESKIPEEFRGVVKDYFEELSRLESRQETAEDHE